VGRASARANILPPRHFGEKRSKAKGKYVRTGTN